MNTAMLTRKLMSQVPDLNENLFIGPESIYTLLQVLNLGARGTTRRELNAFLGTTGFSEDEIFQSVMHRQPAEVTLASANRLYLQQGFQLRDAYQVLVQPLGGAEEVNFGSGQVEAQINDWVKKNTRQMIQKIFEPGTLDAGVAMVAVNAIYFLGKWLSMFNDKLTKLQDFTLLNGGKSQAPLMYQQYEYGYAELGFSQVLYMPYQGHEIGMLICLPSLPGEHGFINAETELLGSLAQVHRDVINFSTKVNTYVPKFKYNWGPVSLTDKLIKLGLVEVFSPRADFSGISETSIYLDDLVHAAAVDNKEEGTEAAAVTGGVMRFAESVPEDPKVFRADHPFIYMIIGKTARVYFVGRFMSPA